MSLLRDKLQAMRLNDKPASANSRRGLSVIRNEFDAPKGLYDPVEALTLTRMGFSGEWPGAEGLLFLDTETTGLAGGAGTIIFLLGAGFIENGKFVVEQYLLGDYCDEAELISRTSKLLKRFDAMVTFNGDAFDIPLLWSRATMNRMSQIMTSPRSFDCLKPSRRLWKKRLGSVKLSVLERDILRRGRTDDLPGAEAPKRFFEYLKTSNRDLLTPVVEHNRLDVISMAYLINELTKRYANPSAQSDPIDMMSMAKALEKTGDKQGAKDCYTVLSAPRSVNSINDLRFRNRAWEALTALGLIYKRMGEYEKAADYFRRSVECGSKDTRAMVELAKYFEHVKKDYSQALNWSNRAIESEKDEKGKQALERRKERLIRRILNGGNRQWD